MAEKSSAASGVECWINGARFATVHVKERMTGAEIRALPSPPIREDFDLFVEQPGGEDAFVRDEETVPVAGRRFFSAPRFIIAGSDAATNYGCYRCGKAVRKFGGTVSPSIWRVFGEITIGTARWWTNCEDCGYVEVVEPHA